MRRQGQVVAAQHLGTVAQAVHEQVLARQESPDVAPAKDPLARQAVAVADGGVRTLVHLLVHVVRDEEVHRGIARHETAQDIQHGRERGGVEPVIGVDDLVVRAPRLAQAGEHGHAVAAVLLVHGADDARIAALPLIGLGRRLVVGAVVNDDDLDVRRHRAPLQDGGDAMVHVGGGVVARDTEGDELARTRRTALGGLRVTHDRR